MKVNIEIECTPVEARQFFGPCLSGCHPQPLAVVFGHAHDVHRRGNLRFPQSLPDFQRLFPDDGACAAYLENARWSDGFVCPIVRRRESRSASQIVLASCAAASAAVTPD